MTTFNIGDKVTRDERGAIFSSSWGVLHGVVKRIYSLPQTIHCDGDLVLGPYPELYGVLWDEAGYKQGYLPHGISKE